MRVYANEVETGDLVNGRKVSIVDTSEKVTLLHFFGGGVLSLRNEAVVEVVRNICKEDIILPDYIGNNLWLDQ